MSQDKQINVRARSDQKQLIARAAKATHKSMTEFILDAATLAAHDALLDQTEFVLDEDEFQAFLDLLDKPLSENRALRELLEFRPPWA